MENLFAESIKDLDIPSDWEYSGYHHDTCPSYIVGNYQIFIYHLNPLKRDEVGEFKDADRFHIFDADSQEDFGSCNDFNTAKKRLEILNKENKQ